MATEVKMPSVGESITSATISEWLVEDGEYVTADDDILSFETDKVSQGLPAGFDGILRHVAKMGDEVDIGAVVAKIEEGEAPAGGEKSESSDSDESEAVDSKAESDSDEGEAEDHGDIRVTPVAKKIAEDKGVDLSKISGTGTGGKITKSDVMAVVDGGESTEPAPAASKDSAPEPCERFRKH